jgi:hypothetical protein
MKESKRILRTAVPAAQLRSCGSRLSPEEMKATGKSARTNNTFADSVARAR